MQSLKKQAGSMLMSALFIAILMLALGLALDDNAFLYKEFEVGTE